MLTNSIPYLYLFLKKPALSLVLILAVSLSAVAQDNDFIKPSSHSRLNPLLVSAFKKPVKPNPNLDEHFRSPRNQLMYWPNYPLTAAQIEARNREWERRNNKTIGVQIASDIANDIIKNQINTLLYGRKTAPAVVPKF